MRMTKEEHAKIETAIRHNRMMYADRYAKMIKANMDGEHEVARVWADACAMFDDELAGVRTVLSAIGYRIANGKDADGNDTIVIRERGAE